MCMCKNSQALLSTYLFVFRYTKQEVVGRHLISHFISPEYARARASVSTYPSTQTHVLTKTHKDMHAHSYTYRYQDSVKRVLDNALKGSPSANPTSLRSRFGMRSLPAA